MTNVQACFNCTSYQVPTRRGGPFSLLLAFLRLPQPVASELERVTGTRSQSYPVEISEIWNTAYFSFLPADSPTLDGDFCLSLEGK